MDNILGDISTEIDFILQRHASNLLRFRMNSGQALDPGKYSEIFEQTLISANREITELGTEAIKKYSSKNPEFNDRVQLIISTSLRRFILINKKS